MTSKVAAERCPESIAAAYQLAGTVFTQYGEELHRFLLRRTGGGAHTANDLAQEVYLRLLRINAAELVRNPQGYTYKIASHVVYEYLLHQENEPVKYDSDFMAALSEHSNEFVCEDAEDQFNREGELRVLLECVPAMYRAVFLLHRRDGWSYEETAERLGLSVHTVKKYLTRTMAKLRHAKWKP